MDEVIFNFNVLTEKSERFKNESTIIVKIAKGYDKNG